MPVTKPPTSYHSALGPAISARPRERVELPWGVAFVHDVTLGYLPDDYAECDVIYAELPWRDGYRAFNRRANADESRSYLELLRSVNAIIESRSCPVAILTGRHALRTLSAPDWTGAPRIHGAPAVLAAYGLPKWRKVPGHEIEIVERLCRTYSVIGDFCCGYGQTGYMAATYGKRFVLSDHNAMCIGVIERMARRWGPHG